MRRENAFREKLANDEPVFGAAAGTFSPTMVETFGAVGVDFVWLDFEHAGGTPEDSAVFETLSRAAEVSDTELLVRLPTGEPPLIRKVLDAGVRNLLVPRVETAEEVREAVEATRFSYDGSPGSRGIGAARTSRWGVDLDEGYADEEDGAVCVGVMIENRTAVENIEEILSVPDLGFVFIGPADLSVSFDRPMETDSPELREAIETVEDAARDTDVDLGSIRETVADAENAIEDGYRVIRIGSDLGAARTVLGERLEALRR